MKIIHINLAMTWRGGERQVFLLFKGLLNNNVEQVLICSRGSALADIAATEGWNHFTIPKSAIPSILKARLIYKLSKSGYNIIHCHESKGHTLAILTKIFWNSDQKLIVHRRVIFPIKRKITTAFKYSEKHIAKMICISKAVESSVKKSIGFNKTVVIPSMINFNNFKKEPSILKEKFGVNSEFIVGYIAALTKEKDHITFLNTAKNILQEGSLDVHFVIVGDGKLKQELIAYTDQLEISHSVTFTGFIENISNIIKDIDLLLFTSISEGLGSTILDFFAAKKPVVATRSGGSEELIKSGKTGYLCNPGDSEKLKEHVIYLLKHPTKMEQIVVNAFKFVQKFNVDNITCETLKVYKCVMK